MYELVNYRKDSIKGSGAFGGGAYKFFCTNYYFFLDYAYINI